MQHASDARQNGVRAFIGKLLKARKDLGFYPPGNPAIRAAMQQCKEAQSEVMRKRAALDLLISRDQFFLADRPLFPMESPERRFAAELFVLGVRRIRFTGEATASELEEFMELLRQARGDALSFKAALSDGGTRSIKGIELNQIADLEVVDESGLAEEIELMLARAQEEDNAAVVNELYLRILPGTLEPGQLSKLMENPVRLKHALGQLARAHEGTAATTVATNVAAKVLHDIASAVGDTPLKEQHSLYRAAAELLINTPEPLRTRLFVEKILPELRSDSPEGALIRSLTDQELVALVIAHVPLHEGALEALSNGFRNLGLSLSRRQSILNLIRSGAEARGPESRRYALLFGALRSLNRTNGLAGDSGPVQGPNLKKVVDSAERLELTPEETSRLQEAVKSAAALPRIENIPALVDLLHLEEDAQRYHTVLSALETLRKEALEHGRLDVALKVVEGYELERQRPGLSAEKWEMLETALEGAASEEAITVLAQMSLHCEKGSPAYSLLLDYLRAVLDRAYHVLLERLEEETSKSLRLAIRGLLIALGRVNIASLSSRVLHKRWFVARNVASILGEMGGDSAVEALANALHHEEPRVRREALNALGKIGGESSARVISSALDDSDNDVALCAARWLVTLSDIAPLDKLFFIVESGRFRRFDPEAVLLAVRAVARKDGAKAAGFLKRIARKRVSSLFGSRRRIAACAAAALREKGG